MKINEVVRIKEGLYHGMYAAVRKPRATEVEVVILGFALPAGYSGPFQTLDYSSVELMPGMTKDQALYKNRKNYDMSSSYMPPR